MPRQAPEWARVPPLPQGHSNSTETQTEWFTLEEFDRRSQQPQQETDGEAIWRATLLAEGQTISSGSSASSSSDSGIGGTHGEFVGEGEYKKLCKCYASVEQRFETLIFHLVQYECVSYQAK